MILRLASEKSAYNIAEINSSRIVTVMYDKRDCRMEIRLLNRSEPLAFECSKDDYNKFLNEFGNAVKKGRGLFEYSL